VIPICFPLAYNFFQSCSTSTSTLVDETVETLLAPVIDKEKFEVRDDEDCQKGKAKAIFPEDCTQANNDKVESDAESVSKLPKRARGRRGHGRGRRSPTVPDDA